LKGTENWLFKNVLFKRRRARAVGGGTIDFEEGDRRVDLKRMVEREMYADLVLHKRNRSRV